VRITRLSGGTVKKDTNFYSIGIFYSQIWFQILTAIHGELNDLGDLATISGYTLAARRIILLAVLEQIIGRYIQRTIGIFVAIAYKTFDSNACNKLRIKCTFLIQYSTRRRK